uniref:C3H1-type domain-containing protein n=1 Tax=Cannabis sativa TaxID=3483 RepID=A0A803NTJ9_CANSA
MGYVEGRSEIPIPTYFIGDYGVGAPKVLLAASKETGNQGFKMDGLKVCKNLYWLKGSGKFTLQESTGSDSTVAELVSEIKPRYHIAGTKGVFYAREPYSNVDAVHVTRFIGLSAVGNKDKQKFIHAISPTPASIMSASEISMKSTNTTISPYSTPLMVDGNEASKRSSDSVTDSQYWRYDVSTKRQKHGAGSGDKMCFKFVSSGTCPREENCHFQHDMAAREQFMRGVCFDFINKGKCERGPDCNFKHSLQEESEGNADRRRRSDNASARSKECWFCISSANVESHLIISIGENFYCALAKGPLVKDHVLVIPVEHLPNTIALSQQCESELDRFQNSLKKFYKNQEKEAVFFEWVSKRSTHANLQVIPVPSSKAAAVQNIFNFAADKMGFKFEVTKFNNNLEGRNSLRTQFDKNLSFFYVELPDGTKLSHVVGENEKFPAQFGREVLAGLLDLAKRADWRNCTCSKEEETKMASDFKAQFQEFDPNE